MSKINDRGNIKWAPFMMPEHIEMLNDYWESQNNVEKPILSEDKYEDMQRTIQEAMDNECEVDIQYYKNNRIKVIEGIIKRPTMDKVEIETRDGIDYLEISDIVDVSVI